MRKVIAILLLAVSVPVLADTIGDLEAVIDLEMTTARLANLTSAEAYDQIPIDRFFILQGSVASTVIYDPNPDTFQAVIELVDGKWVELQSIDIYRVYLLVEGPEYADRIFDRLPRDPGPEVIQTNQDLLVVGYLYGYSDAEDGSVLPVVQAVMVRN